MAIQPKNTTDIKVDKISEKTVSAGITLDNIVKCDNFAEKTAAAKSSFANGIKTDTITEKTPGAGITLSSTLGLLIDKIYEATATAGTLLNGVIQVVKAVAGYTSGGTPLLGIANVATASVTPVTAFSYTLSAVNTQVVLLCFVMTRDNVADTMSFFLTAISGGRVAGAAVAGSVGASTAVNGTALNTMTVVASSNDLQVKSQNVSGTNQLYTRIIYIAIPVKTSA